MGQAMAASAFLATLSRSVSVHVAWDSEVVSNSVQINTIHHLCFFLGGVSDGPLEVCAQAAVGHKSLLNG